MHTTTSKKREDFANETEYKNYCKKRVKSILNSVDVLTISPAFLEALNLCDIYAMEEKDRVEHGMPLDNKKLIWNHLAACEVSDFIDKKGLKSEVSTYLSERAMLMAFRDVLTENLDCKQNRSNSIEERPKY